MQLTQSLHRAVQINADGLAIVYGDDRRTWRQFYDAVPKVAGMLRSRGVGDDSKVVIISANSARFIECLYAIPWAGGVMVPINFRLQQDEINYIVEHSDAEVVLYEEQFASMVEHIRAAVPTLKHFVVLDADRSRICDASSYAAAVAHAPALEDVVRNGADLAALFYTGGTTGTPKGVMLTHDNLYHFILTFLICERIDSSLVHLHVVPMFHLSCIGVLVTTAVAGTHVVLPKFDPLEALQAIDAHAVTHCLSVPVMLERMVFHPRISEFHLSSLKMLGYGASPMPPNILEETRRRFPNLQLAQAYGMTEAPGPVYLGPEFHGREAVEAGVTRAAGRSVPTCEVKIFGPDDEERPHGEFGEIVIRGPVVMKGYWKNPQLTAEVLRGGWLHTGDGGYMDAAGFVYITDRIKDMIISGGENVYSNEVEAVILRHPAVEQCAIIGIPSERWGESVHAIVLLKSGFALTADELIAFCKERIAGYKCPRSVEFRTEALPMNAAGKLQKAKLREPFWRGRVRKI